MDLLTILQGSLEMLLTWQCMLSIFTGLLWGTIMGAIPGLGIVLAIAIGIPFTLMMNPVNAMAFLLAVYEGAIYGGSISAILIGAPGTPAAAATVFDGYPMCKKGQAGKALEIALYSSVIGNLFGEVTLILIAAQIAKVALKFGPPEKFSLIIFALTIIGSSSGRSLPKGLISATIGFMIAIVGTDEISGSFRFTFGTLELQSGIGLIPLLVGIFAVSELIVIAESRTGQVEAVLTKSDNPDDNRFSIGELKKELRTIFESSALGVFFGCLPGLGSTVAAFISYGNAQRRSKDPDSFGKGNPTGVAAAESGNNAVAGGALVPTITLGIPGDIANSVLLGAFMLHGLRPGPELFTKHPVETYAIFLTLIVSSFMLFFIGKAGIKLFVRFLNITKQTLIPVVLLFCFVGTYSVSTSIFDLGLMVFFGVVGYFLRKFKIPLTPFLIAYVLEPIAEAEFMRSIIISDGDPSIFLTRPISLAFIILMVLSVGFTIYHRKKHPPLGDF
jgi:putative tricarboxylic transport membrane protein